MNEMLAFVAAHWPLLVALAVTAYALTWAVMYWLFDGDDWRLGAGISILFFPLAALALVTLSLAVAVVVRLTQWWLTLV